jgi:hypothetical protein
MDDAAVEKIIESAPGVYPEPDAAVEKTIESVLDARTQQDATESVLAPRANARQDAAEAEIAV